MEYAAEPTQTDFKPPKKCGFGWCCAVFVRWVLILLFVVILVGGLYFKAPWKILVLDAILLALLTVVPKQKRKYGWLALAAAVLAVAVWIFIPEKDTGDWRPYTFDEEVAALNAKYGVPDDENAAPYYEQIEVTDFYADQPHKIIKVNQPFEFNREPRGPAQWDPDDETLSRPWTAEEFPELAAWLETEKEKIAPFFEAVKFDKCWFEVSASPNATFNNLEVYSTIKRTAVIVQRMIYQDLGNNNTQEAIDKSLGLLQSSYHLQQQCSLIDNLVGWAIYANSVAKINDLIINCPLDEGATNLLKSHISRFEKNWPKFIDRALEREDILYKNLLGALYEVNDNGQVRFTRKPLLELNPFELSRLPQHLMEKGKKPSIFWRQRQNKLQRFFRFMAYPQPINDVMEIHNDILSDITNRLLEQDFDYHGPENIWQALKQGLTLRSLMEINTELQFGSFRSISNIYARIETQQKASLIIFELKRYHNQHNQWPESLEQIKDQLPDEVFVDSLNGQQIAFMKPKNCDTFILYSFGEDGIDDKGFRGHTWKESEKKRDDYLFWPQNEDELMKILGIEEPEEENMTEGMML